AILRALYKYSPSRTLRSGGRSARDRAAAATDTVVGSVQGLLRPPGAARIAAAVCRRLAGRQRPQVDVGDAGACQRADVVSGVPALHHACAVGCRSGLASASGGKSRADRHPDPRRNELPEGGPAFGRGGATVLWGAGEGGELPSGGHRRALDVAARMADGRVALSAGDVDGRSG